jgi:hypothetical protein
MSSGKIALPAGQGAGEAAPTEEQDILIYKSVNCGY